MQGILLAAGTGRRFEKSMPANAIASKDKLLNVLPEHQNANPNSQQRILECSARALIAALPDSIAVVQPHQVERQHMLNDLGFTVVKSTRAIAGMGYAIADAVGASAQANGWLIALGDMPWVSTDLIQSICKQVTEPMDIAAPRFNGKRGQPVAFGAHWFDALFALEGDVGARALLKTEPVQWLDWHDNSIHRDIDTIADLLS